MGTGRLVPSKLRRGDTVRVVAPSRSLAILPDEQHATCARRFEELGLRVSFGRRVRELDAFRSSSVASRVADLHDAFLDPEIRGVFSIIGGFNANQLLRAIDWDLVAAHPKVFCGYSDITALENAMLARANLVTYCGPHFSTFAMLQGIEYDLEFLRRCVMDEGAYEITPSPTWSDDAWFLDQENRTFHPNAGPRTLQPGSAEGVAVGGNLCTFNLLHGTPWMPPLAGAVVFVEEDEQAGQAGVAPEEFDRNLQSLLHQPGGDALGALVIGRFQKRSEMTVDALRAIVASKEELRGVPVACDLDFGHTTPHFTFPVGGRVRLDCTGTAPRLTVLVH
jgi:muramoyltetrapeptide carboxypeptidase LdcA involved in peptidoglycan recycling